MAHPQSSRVGIRPPSRASWSSQIEARSVGISPELLSEAIDNTSRVQNNISFLAMLAREISQTRGPELVLAYRSLVWVLPGFRKSLQAGRVITSSEVCVLLVVRRKKPMEAGHAQLLPKWLVTFAEHHGRRKPFALPTDVQDAEDHRRAVAHTDSGVWCQRQGYAAENGSFACLVELTHDEGSQLCLLGAMHVFTPRPDGSARVEQGHAMMPISSLGKLINSPLLAEGLPWGGRLLHDELPGLMSFDVQLAAVCADAVAAVRERVALRRPNIKRCLESSEDLFAILGVAGDFCLLTPDNHPDQPGRGAIPLRLAAMPSLASFPYRFSSDAGAVSRMVFHAEPLLFNTVDDRSPMPGDSGSPIVFLHPDNTMTFVAMHIGGDGAGNSWAIPAWRMFDLENWSAVPGNAQMTIIEP